MRTIAAPTIASLLLILSLFAFSQRPTLRSKHVTSLPAASNGALVSFRTSGLAHLTVLKDGTRIYNGSTVSAEHLRGDLTVWCAQNSEHYPTLRISLHPDTPMRDLRETYESVSDVGLNALSFAVHVPSSGA